MLRYLTAGESHGQVLTAIIEGVPAGLPLTAAEINLQLARRQCGYGRGPRMKMEKDEVTILSGVRHGLTLGSPITLQIANRDWKNWQEIMAVAEPSYPDNPASSVLRKLQGEQRLSCPRPGHADLSGALKYRQQDLRNVLERASARETACRTAVGSVAACLLRQLNIQVYGQVISIGVVRTRPADMTEAHSRSIIEKSALRLADALAEEEAKALIDQAQVNGDSLGGTFLLEAQGVPVGLGSYVQADRRLDGRIAGALMSIQAVKGVEIGAGFAIADKPGSQVQDEIYYEADRGFYRTSNHCGGIEGGVSNGEAIMARVAVKPIPTLQKPLHSVDFTTKEEHVAAVQRADVCAVPSACVIGENVLAWELAAAVSEKFGGDSLPELLDNYRQYQQYIRQV